MAEHIAKQGAMKKRQQIKDSSRMMFFWVAGMSALAGCAVVVSWFLWQQITFKDNVITEKNKTVDTLRENNKAAPELKSNLRALNTNTALNDAKADPNDKALQAILDALPSEANSPALGSSLTNKLASDIPGLTIENISVTPAQSEQQDGEDVASSSSGETAENTISFTMTVVAGDVNAFKDMLERFERSIRVIDIDTMQLDSGEDEYRLTIGAHAYYQPAKKIELKKEVVKP